jgi:hypothetical protein
MAIGSKLIKGAYGALKDITSSKPDAPVDESKRRFIKGAAIAPVVGAGALAGISKVPFKEVLEESVPIIKGGAETVKEFLFDNISLKEIMRLPKVKRFLLDDAAEQEGFDSVAGLMEEYGKDSSDDLFESVFGGPGSLDDWADWGDDFLADAQNFVTTGKPLSTEDGKVVYEALNDAGLEKSDIQELLKREIGF